MSTIKGPAVFLAQFSRDNKPFNSLEGMCQWASNLGYKGIQIPSWNTRLIDINKAADSKTYCDEIIRTRKLLRIRDYRISITPTGATCCCASCL